MKKLLERAKRKLKEAAKIAKKDLRPEFCWKCKGYVVLCPLPDEKFVFCLLANENAHVFNIERDKGIKLENSMSPAIIWVAKGHRCSGFIPGLRVSSSSPVVKRGESYIKKIMGW